MHPADEFLMHYGVAGMKWGRRRARTDDERAATKAKVVKGLKVAGTVVAVAAVTAGAIYAGKQLQGRAGERAIKEFDNSELRDIVQSGQLFSRKVAQKTASVKVSEIPLPREVKPPRQLVKKATIAAAKKAQPTAIKAAQAARPYAQQAAMRKVSDIIAKNNAKKLKDLDDTTDNLIGNTDEMLGRARR